MQKIKERLFGIVVLLSIGIIFIPMLMPQSNKKHNLTDMQMNIPVVDSSVLPIIEPENIVRLKQLEKPMMDVALTEASSTVPQEQAPELILDALALTELEANLQRSFDEPITAQLETTPGLPVAWAVQLGAFQDVKNASVLVKKLQKWGYSAYAKEIQSMRGTFTLVLVGPKAQKEEALTLKQTLEAKYQLKGMVVQHQPVAS